MSSGFISESEIVERRRIRQEEWDRVRTAAQPLEAPEEPYDPRCLYDRLQEQKIKKDTEYEEAHKLKNMIKGLDDDEVEFLDLIDRTKMAEERKKNLEEEKEMRDFKAAVASLQEKSSVERLKQELKQPQMSNKSSTSSSKNSQLRLLAGVVKKPAKSEDASQGVKRKVSETKSSSPEKKSEEATQEKQFKGNDELKKEPAKNSDLNCGALKCVAILPGLGSYENSSNSDTSESDSDEENFGKQKKVDMLGREIVIPEEKVVEQ